MPSFDIVSEVDKHELSNAVDQANREVGNRFDFKGSNSKIVQNDMDLRVESDSKFRVDQVRGILYEKLTKRGIDIGCLGIISSRLFLGCKENAFVIIHSLGQCTHRF